MRSAVIPTIFSAVDKLTAPVRAMTGTVHQFADKAQAGIARSERIFRKLTPALSETSKQLLSFASTAAIAGAVVSGVAFSVDSIKEYEKSVASFRTIVSDLSNGEFAEFQSAINRTAKTTKKSSVEVAQAFEKIAGLNADFAKTPQAISSVTTAVITLSKASGDELGPSAESLVGIMNQFGFAADQADRTINVLAAGAGVGAASITQTAEAFVNFGSVAKGANISLEQSVGLIQTLGKFSVFGAEAGTKLRGSILKLTQAGLGYKSGQFQINDALTEAKHKIDKLKTAKEKDAAILKMFGAENIATGKILLNNVDTFNKYTSGVTGTQAATLQAAIRSDTLTTKLEELKAGWVNMITGSDRATSGINLAKKAIGFLTDNLDTVVSVGTKVVLFFVAWKAIMIASKIALFAYNIALGIYSALAGESAFATYGNTVAYGAYRTAVVLGTAAQWALNTAMLANPVLAIVAGVLALVAALGYLIANYRSVQALHEEGMKKKRSESFNEEAKQVEFLASRYEKYGRSKIEANKAAIATAKENLRAEIQEVKAQYVSAKTDEQKRIAETRFASLQGRAESLGQMESDLKKGITVGDKNKAAVEQGNAYLGMSPYRSQKEKLYDESPLPMGGGGTDRPLVNPKQENRDALIQQMTKTNNAEVTLNIKGDTDKVDAKQDKGFVKIKTTSTMGN